MIGLQTQPQRAQGSTGTIANGKSGTRPLGFLGTLALYSQYILLAALVLGAVALNLSAH